MKRIISLFLAAVMTVSVFAVSINAYAVGWADYVKDYKLDKNYVESVTDKDYHERLSYYKSFRFQIPADGRVTIRFESENKELAIKLAYYSNGEDEHGLGFTEKYIPAKALYRSEREIDLKKGTYYMFTTYFDKYVEDGTLAGNYTVRLIYRPTFADTEISKVAAKKKAAVVKWNKASKATGYQIQYSLKKNMKNAKIKKVAKVSTRKITIKKLKKNKRYYFRIRTYKTLNVDGKTKTYYGKWSAKESVKMSPQNKLQRL